MPVPPFQAFVEPLLRVLSEHPEGLATSAAHEAAAARLGLTDADKAQLQPSGQQALYKNRNAWAHDRLKRAELSESSAFGKWCLTSAGVAFVQSHPDALSDDELSRITDVSSSHRAAVWRDRLEAFRADAPWAAELTATKASRQR